MLKKCEFCGNDQFNILPDEGTDDSYWTCNYVCWVCKWLAPKE